MTAKTDDATYTRLHGDQCGPCSQVEAMARGALGSEFTGRVAVLFADAPGRQKRHVVTVTR